MPYKNGTYTHAFPEKFPPHDADAGTVFIGTSSPNGSGRIFQITPAAHLLTIGRPRSGKGACLIVPNLQYHWRKNAIVIDVKGENAALSWQHRKERLGQAVGVLDPFAIADVPDELRVSINPLDLIDLSSPFSRTAISSIANGLIVEHNPDHAEWTEAARAILAGIIADVADCAPPDRRNLQEVRDIIMLPNGAPTDQNPEPSGLFEYALNRVNSPDAPTLTKAAAVAILTALTSSRGLEKDAFNQARRATGWLDDPYITAALSGTSFDLRQLKYGRATLFLVLPAASDTMKTYAGFLRLFVKAALNVMEDGGRGSGRGEKCLFLLDEFFSLGTMPELAEAAGRLPSAGVHLWPFVQSLGQLQELYGDKIAEEFIQGADAVTVLGVNDTITAKWASDRIGLIQINDLEIAPPTRAISDGGIQIDGHAKQVTAPLPPLPERNLPTRQLPPEPMPRPARPGSPPLQRSPHKLNFQPVPPAPGKRAGIFDFQITDGIDQDTITSNQNAMMEYQAGEATSRAIYEGKRNAWEEKDRQLQTKFMEERALYDANEMLKQREFERDRTISDIKLENERSEYNHALSFVGKERITPEQVRLLTAKEAHNKPATITLAFMPEGSFSVYTVPYWRKEEWFKETKENWIKVSLNTIDRLWFTELRLTDSVIYRLVKNHYIFLLNQNNHLITDLPYIHADWMVNNWPTHKITKSQLEEHIEFMKIQRRGAECHFMHQMLKYHY